MSADRDDDSAVVGSSSREDRRGAPTSRDDAYIVRLSSHTLSRRVWDLVAAYARSFRVARCAPCVSRGFGLAVAGAPCWAVAWAALEARRARTLRYASGRAWDYARDDEAPLHADQPHPHHGGGDDAQPTTAAGEDVLDDDDAMALRDSSFSAATPPRNRVSGPVSVLSDSDSELDGGPLVLYEMGPPNERGQPRTSSSSSSLGPFEGAHRPWRDGDATPRREHVIVPGGCLCEPQPWTWTGCGVESERARSNAVKRTPSALSNSVERVNDEEDDPRASSSRTKSYPTRLLARSQEAGYGSRVRNATRAWAATTTGAKRAALLDFADRLEPALFITAEAATAYEEVDDDDDELGHDDDDADHLDDDDDDDDNDDERRPDDDDDDDNDDDDERGANHPAHDGDSGAITHKGVVFGVYGRKCQSVAILTCRGVEVRVFCVPQLVIDAPDGGGDAYESLTVSFKTRRGGRWRYPVNFDVAAERTFDATDATHRRNVYRADVLRDLLAALGVAALDDADGLRLVFLVAGVQPKLGDSYEAPRYFLAWADSVRAVKEGAYDPSAASASSSSSSGMMHRCNSFFSGGYNDDDDDTDGGGVDGTASTSRRGSGGRRGRQQQPPGETPATSHRRGGPATTTATGLRAPRRDVGGYYDSDDDDAMRGYVRRRSGAMVYGTLQDALFGAARHRWRAIVTREPPDLRPYASLLVFDALAQDLSHCWSTHYGRRHRGFGGGRAEDDDDDDDDDRGFAAVESPAHAGPHRAMRRRLAEAALVPMRRLLGRFSSGAGGDTGDAARGSFGDDRSVNLKAGTVVVPRHHRDRPPRLVERLAR